MEKFDIFGHKVNFTFKNNMNYRTNFGGLCSILLLIIVSVFAARSLLRMASRDVLSFSTDYQ
jgi:hypothetical protein